MEMPFDVLNHRLGKLRDSGLLEGDNTAIAIDIDQDLQRQFIFIPQEEIDAVEIQDRGEGAIQKWEAGSGPETIRAHHGDNPAWLYNSAVHALAMYQHLQKLEKEREAEAAKLAKRPEPGVYQGSNRGGNYFVVIVTTDKRVLVPQTEGGADDYTKIWDADPELWKLQRIDVADGTIAGSES